MPSVVITGHGGRKGGTAVGTYLIPPGVTVYFFTKDATVLYADASDAIMDKLCTAHPNELLIRGMAVDVKTAYETVPNYTCFGTTDFRDPSGAYRVGAAPLAATLVVPVPNNTEKRLSEIIGGTSSGGVIGSHVYWLCCRAAPDNSNNIDDNSDIVTGHVAFGGPLLEVGAVEVGSTAGLTPSRVRELGSWR